MSVDVKALLATLVLAAISTTPAFSQILSQIEDRDRPDLRPETSNKALPPFDGAVPLPRVRPKISTAIPLTRPAPAAIPAPVPLIPEVGTPEATISSPTFALPPKEPTTAATPKAGDVFMPIPTIPMPSRRLKPESD